MEYVNLMFFGAVHTKTGHFDEVSIVAFFLCKPVFCYPLYSLVSFRLTTLPNQYRV